MSPEETAAKICKEYASDARGIVPLSVEVAQAIREAEQRGREAAAPDPSAWLKHMPSLQIYDICLAYESGFGQGEHVRTGRKLKPNGNAYEEGTPSYAAYDIGVQAGLKAGVKVVSSEQAARIREVLADTSPATPALREAAQKARVTRPGVVISDTHDWCVYLTSNSEVVCLRCGVATHYLLPAKETLCISRNDRPVGSMWLCKGCCGKHGISTENKDPHDTADCEECGADREYTYLCFNVPIRT